MSLVNVYGALNIEANRIDKAQETKLFENVITQLGEDPLRLIEDD